VDGSKKVKYLWIKNKNKVNEEVILIDDPRTLVGNSEYDESTDELYQVGPQIKIKVVIENVPSIRNPLAKIGDNTRFPSSGEL
jgi:hypothetical protein